jgi:hypothetical protein
MQYGVGDPGAMKRRVAVRGQECGRSNAVYLSINSGEYIRGVRGFRLQLYCVPGLLTLLTLQGWLLVGGGQS